MLIYLTIELSCDPIHSPNLKFKMEIPNSIIVNIFYKRALHFSCQHPGPALVDWLICRTAVVCMLTSGLHSKIVVIGSEIFLVLVWFSLVWFWFGWSSWAINHSKNVTWKLQSHIAIINRDINVWRPKNCYALSWPPFIGKLKHELVTRVDPAEMVLTVSQGAFTTNLTIKYIG